MPKQRLNRISLRACSKSKIDEVVTNGYFMSSFAVVYSRASCGMQAPLVTVETHISSGLPKFSIVGLAETAVKESKDRVRSALINCRFNFPISRITVNLAPADLPKEGGRFDLPIALSILGASGQLPTSVFSSYEFGGELGLQGDLRPIHGILPFALATIESKRSLFIPKVNDPIDFFTDDLSLFFANDLLEVCAHLTGSTPLTPHVSVAKIDNPATLPDLSQVRGQLLARRALEIAAAGEHHFLMVGPPGTGKTLLASCLPGILPPMNKQEAITVAVIDSLTNASTKFTLSCQRRFRSPHHTASSVALVGGGNPPHPGEVSLAHHGVLFLDELPEFNRNVLEALREPLENGHITISRARYQSEFPAKFQFIASMNPCPCGYLGDTQTACRCSPDAIRRYLGRISGPLLDRIDLQVKMPRLAMSELVNDMPKIEASETVRQRVVEARTIQLSRCGKSNAQLNSSEVEAICQFKANEKKWFSQIADKFNFSPRKFYRLLRVARTIADLDQTAYVGKMHLSEALTYRNSQFQEF